MTTDENKPPFDGLRAAPSRAEGPPIPPSEPAPDAKPEGEGRHEGAEEGAIPIYLKLAYVIIAIWSVIYFLLYFR